MRKLTLISLGILVVILATPVKAEEQNVSTKGNSNVTNVCQPNIVVESCKSCENTCKAPKVVYKDRIKVQYKTKTVQSKPIIKYQTKTIVRKFVRKPKRNRLKMLVGHGPVGVSAERINANEAVAFERKGGILGLGYERLLTDSISIGIQAQTNETYLGSVGFDF